MILQQLAGLSCYRMAGRIFQERLRAWVKARTREYGERKRLSLALGRQGNWVTKFVQGDADAEIDDAVLIAKFYRIGVAAVFGEQSLPPADPVMARMCELLTKVPPQFLPEVQGTLELFVRLQTDVPPPPNGSPGGARGRKGRRSL